MHNDHDDRRDGPDPCHRQSWRKAGLSTTRSHSGSIGIVQRVFAVRVVVAYYDVNLRKCMDLACPGKHDLGTGPAKISVRAVYEYDAISSGYS